MDLFPDGEHVRLRSRVRDTYLHADEDGIGVSLSARSTSLNTVWRVHRVERDGVPLVLLHSAAYARYLAASPVPAPRGHRGHRAFQRLYNSPQQDDVAWDVQAVFVQGSLMVLLRHHVSDRLLRANGRYLFWNNGVSVEALDNPSTMMYWLVHRVFTTEQPPALPLPTPEQPVLQRLILYVLAETPEHVDPLAWRLLWFSGRSVFQLRTDLAEKLNENDDLAITLCVRAGPQGRLIPLVTDLPRNGDPMFIVVLTTGSPAALGLRYPDLEEP